MPAPDDKTPASFMDEFVQRLVTSRQCPAMTPGTTIPEGSPKLDEPLRSRHEAALDIAVKALTQIQSWNQANPAGFGTAAWASLALDKIEALVPEAVP